MMLPFVVIRDVVEHERLGGGNFGDVRLWIHQMN